MKLEQVKKAVTSISIVNNLGSFKKVVKEEKYTFEDNLIKYKSYCFYFKKKTSLFYETNLVQVDFLDNIIKIYNPINGNLYYIGYFAKKKGITNPKRRKKGVKMYNINWKNEKNLNFLMDFYELTMTNGYLLNEDKNTIVYFDYFFRKVPDNGGFAIAAGLETFINELTHLRFGEEEIEFLSDMGMFSIEFLQFLEEFSFSGDIYAIPEGTPVFPNTPILTVKASILEAQVIETLLLTTLNHQSLIATKANRIVRSANNKSVVDFGARRAHGADASIYGARASYIGGFNGTSNVLAHKMFDIPVLGTMAHSWVQYYGDDLTAFETYKKAYPKNSTFLVDTFDVINSGVPNAIKVFKTMEKDAKKGIRLDSGDLNYLSQKTRKMLDEEGLEEVKIVASNSLDEFKINEIESDPNSKIDFYGVGERMITAKSEPVFGGVYKLAAVEKNGKLSPRIKMSETQAKITNPGAKELYRLYDKETGKAFADYITVKGEKISNEILLFDELMPWREKVVTEYDIKKLQKEIIKDGKLVYDFPSLSEIREYRERELNTLWDSLLKLNAPDDYFVNLSFKLWGLKRKLLQEHSSENLKKQFNNKKEEILVK